MPNRRTYLASVAAGLASLAGCQSSASPPASSTAQTTAATTDSVDVSVDRTVVRKAVTYESFMGSGGVLARGDRQYVVSEVRTERDLSPSAFAFVAGDRSWSPGLPETAGGNNLSVAGRGDGALGRAGGTTFLAFTVPSPLSASDPRIEWTEGGATWPLSSDARETLAAPGPEFELQSLDVPGSVTRGDPLSVSMTVANVSETDGRFLAAVYLPTTVADDDESHVVERDVAAGETVTLTLEIPTDYADGENEVSLTVRGHVSGERTVDLRNA